MSSYNCLNGQHTSSRYDLLTDVLRGEWGFDGFVMTDWDSHSDKPYDYMAGNDIVMGGYPTDPIAAAVTGKSAQFDRDGAVRQDKIAMYGGIFHKTVDAWNSFAPSADGKDRLTVPVEKGVKLSGRVDEAVKAGYATITENADGSRTVTYTGTDRGAYLPLGDLQRSAMRVLKVLAENAPMKLGRLNAEYAELLSGKKAAYAEYRKLRDEAQELTIARTNIESLYEAERKETEHRDRERSH